MAVAADGGFALYRSGQLSEADLAELCRLGVEELVVLDAESGEVLLRVTLAGQPGEISVSRDGKLVAVSVPEADAIEILSLDGAGVAQRTGRFEVEGPVGALSWLP